MKFLFLYLLSLFFGWLGINSLLIGIDNWAVDGAAIPVLVGTLCSLLAIRLIGATVKMYTRSRRDKDLLL